MSRLYSASCCRLFPALLLLCFAQQLPCAAQERPGPPPPAHKLVLAVDEQAILDDVKDGKFVKQSFAEAALLASGVTDAQKRKAYLDRIAALEGKARQAVSGAKTPFERGERLLAWIYAGGPIGPVGPGKQKRYEAGQTRFSVLLDTGSYNCVSVTTLYNVLGRRLDLDVRAIEVSDHVFSILYDGTEHADVETTTPRGFNPVRDKAALKEFTDLTGFAYIPARQRKHQREINEAGLVATIYYNRGVEYLRDKRFREAFHVNVCALHLDPGLASAAKNARAALGRWAGDTTGDGKFDRAVDLVKQNAGWLKDPSAATPIIIGVYDERGSKLSKDRNDAGRAELYTNAYTQHRDNKDLARHFERNGMAAYDKWAESLTKEGKWREAKKVCEDGLKPFPGDKFLQQTLEQCRKKDKPPQ